ncbi:uncharacterized protein LOC131691471 isoform X7 [Topomyia yanbarensis]|uniref:uncharacterized protein LOC131691471 isoform X7 n=1 Tax=Topomyia yanbarensis TaxID=2498891 RepID=UPI00273C86A5|nr:uncharacterized protein LOC131691471 isoform X7 [Topomyia yanbarensis]
MRDLPKSTTHVVKKASDIFVSGERGSAAHHHHLFAGSGSGKLQSPSKVVSSGGSSSRLNRFSEGIKASPTRQSLVVAAESNSFHLTSSDSEDAEAQALNVDEGSDEVSSSGSCTSEVEIDGAGGCGDDDDDDDEDGDGDDDDDDDDFCSVERAVSADDGIGSSLVAKINGGMAHNLASEDSRIPRLKKLRDGKQKDESTCRDDDFTWVNSRNEAPKASIDSDRRSTSHTTVGGRSVRSRTGGGQDPNTTANVAPLTPESPLGPGCGKPPRPMTSSLDRRRHNLGASRYERDTKSRSTHSLKDKSSSSELHKPDSQSSSLSLNSKGKAERKRVGPGKGAIDDKFWIFEEHQHDSGNYNNYNSSGSSHHHHHGNSSRQSPGIWEPPPPPPTSHWDPHYYWNWNHQSREELRLIDYHRRQQEMYRYGSNGALSSTQESPCSSGCCNRGYYQPPPPPCCSCEHSRMIWGKDCQRQDTDERLRRLQTDKEALALQVKVLTEQVQTQSTKITELERTVHEKNKLISNADDLLQRVSEFAKTVGIQIDKQKEMLSRSSLETQKLELMSAMSELKLQQAALERENLELRSSLVNGSGTLSNGTLLSSSTLNNNNITASIIRRATPMLGIGRMVTSTPGNSINSSPLHHGSHGSLPQQVVTNLPSPSTPKTPPASYRQRVDIHYNSLPRQAFATTLSTVSGSSGSSGASATTNGSSSVDANANLRRNVAFADSGTASSDRTDGSASQRNYTPNPTPSPSMSHKNLKGLRNIFGKIKRSNSGTLEDVPLDNGEFRRGGIRATAGARLGWSVEFRKPDKPFREWSLDTLCLWFEQMGLNMYEEELRRWLKVGGAAELAQASPVDIEKELNLKNPLHRKKIVLAVADMAESDESDTLFKNSGKLDTPWVIRWLDDIGLPQHKDSFTAARMDGRMLHKLTMDDLVNLHVSSCLHVASLRRGIQLMREQQWNPDCLIRRSITDDSCGIKDEVQLWSSHRVMEWLRLVDLSEYAPNLRGAGVHGALMMYEVKFTAELLAELLSMPPSKTLLRRHLATHFKELLGRDIIQVKRDAENTLGFQPLTLAAKIKTPKKSQFSLKRKKSSKGQNGDEWSDYVCPMGDSGQEHLPPQRQHPSPSPSASAASSVNSAVVVTTTTSATSANRHQHQHQSHNSHASSASPYSANINHVTSNSMAATTKIPYTTYPDSTLSSSTTSSTTTSGAGSEVASHQQLLTNVNSTAGSDSPTSTRSSTTSTS